MAKYQLLHLIAMVACIFLSITKGHSQHNSLSFTIEDSILYDSKPVLNKIANYNADRLLLLESSVKNIWNSKLLSNEKSLILKTLRDLTKKNYPLQPYYTNFYECLIDGVEKELLSKEELTNWLSITNKVIMKFSIEEYRDYLYLSHNIINRKDTLYQSKNLSIKILKGNISFLLEENYENSSLLKNNYLSIANENIDYCNTKKFDIESVLPNIFIGIKDAIMEISFPNTKSKIELEEGILFLRSLLIVGGKGKVELKTDEEAYCTFSNFSFFLKENSITIPNTEIHYPEKLHRPLKGVYINKHSKLKNIYPTFKSYESITLDYPDKEISIKGAITIEKDKFYTSGCNNAISTLKISGSNKLTITASSREGFYITDSTIYSPVSKICLFHIDQDSLNHYGINFDYNINNQILKLSKINTDEYKFLGFSDSYFQIIIYPDVTQWDIKNNNIYFQTFYSRDKIPLIIESKNFYNDFILSKLSINNKINSIQFLSSIVSKYRSTKLSVYDLAEEYNIVIPTEDKKDREIAIRSNINYLQSLGFVNYTNEKDSIELTEKGRVYCNNTNLRIHDNIRISSRVGTGNNALINIEAKKLTIYGVKSISMDNNVNTILQPKDQRIIMLKNRDIQMDGTLSTGKFFVESDSFYFSYDSFYVDIKNNNSLSFISKDTSGLVKSNEVTDIEGRIWIYDTKDRSGKTKLQEYPKIETKRGQINISSQEEINRRQVDIFSSYRDSSYYENLFFRLKPFSIDSGGINNNSAIEFPATFSSGGIFKEEDIGNQTASVNRDYIGFSKKIPERGFDIYNAKGKFYNYVHLREQGLIGDGTLKYLDGEFTSDDFLFYVDSLTLLNDKNYTISTSNGYIKATSHNPSIELKNFDIRWLPYKNEMYLKTTIEDFLIFENLIPFTGTIFYDNNGVIGDGKINHPNYTLFSQAISFASSSFKSKNTLLKIQSYQSKPYLMTKNIDLYYNSDKDILLSEDMLSHGIFLLPINKYQLFSRNFSFDISNQKINFEDNSIKFQSVETWNRTSNPLPIEFTGNNVIYDLNENIVTVKGIQEIDIASASIIMNNEDLHIMQEGSIKELTNVSIKIDSSHIFHPATIKILSKNEFEGFGTYTYINPINHSFTIQFDEFLFNEESAKEETLITLEAISTIDTSYIELTKDLLFSGQAIIAKGRKAIHFDGAIRLNIGNELDYPWVSYTNKINDAIENSIYIDDRLKELETGEQIALGITIDQYNRELNGYFMEYKEEFIEDIPILIPKGYLLYDERENFYTIKSKNKNGNFFIYNPKTKEIAFKDNMRLLDIENIYNFKSIGEGSYNLTNNIFKSNTIISLNPLLNKKNNHLMENDFKNSLENNETLQSMIDNNLDRYNLLFDLDKSSTNTEDILGSSSSLLERLKDLLIIEDVDIEWSSEYQSFYNAGRATIKYMFGRFHNLVIDAYIELPKHDNTDIIHMLFILPSEEWYYISIKKNNIIFSSSNANFNKNLKRSSRLVSIDEVADFADNFRHIYLGIDELIYLKDPSVSSDTDYEEDILDDIWDEEF